ncbi:hypothetical protein [Chitinophaga skermanii]|nr:hypothetical protein [Chitinophaga skermanii]
MKLVIASSMMMAAMLIIGTHAAQAQDTSARKTRWTAEGKADKMGDKLDRQLSLNKVQSKQVREINEDTFKKLDALRRDTSVSKRDRMQQIKDLNNERTQRFKTVLTPSQYKKWNDWELKKKEQLEAKMDRKQQRRESRSEAL